MAANDRIYLHELITIVGTGSEAYKEHTGQLGGARADDENPLVGTFQQSGSTGPWPIVVNLWEMTGWGHWAQILEKQYTRTSGQEPALRKWWTEATAHRSGGFDRILAAAPFSPTRRELIDRGVRGAAVIQEIATVKPGKAADYLDAVATHWRAKAAKRGLELIGAWETTMRDTEAMLMWCVPTFRVFTDYLADVRKARDARVWLAKARTWRTDYRETLLVPSPWCVTHPDWTDPRAQG